MGFYWCMPRWNTYRPADYFRLQVGLNRYPDAVIGAYVILLGRLFGVRWKRTR